MYSGRKISDKCEEPQNCHRRENRLPAQGECDYNDSDANVAGRIYTVSLRESESYVSRPLLTQTPAAASCKDLQNVV